MRTFILREQLMKVLATPPPDYLAQCMKTLSSEDRESFIEKMQNLYSARIEKLRQFTCGIAWIPENAPFSRLNPRS